MTQKIKQHHLDFILSLGHIDVYEMTTLDIKDEHVKEFELIHNLIKKKKYEKILEPLKSMEEPELTIVEPLKSTEPELTIVEPLKIEEPELTIVEPLKSIEPELTIVEPLKLDIECFIKDIVYNIVKNVSTIKTNNNANLKTVYNLFKKECVMEAIRGYNVKMDLYYIKLDTLTKYVSKFESANEKIECSIIYDEKKKNKWLNITKEGEFIIDIGDKLLSTMNRIFNTTDKFKKKINNINVRASKLKFLIYKTCTLIDIYVVLKEKIN